MVHFFSFRSGTTAELTRGETANKSLNLKRATFNKSRCFALASNELFGCAVALTRFLLLQLVKRFASEHMRGYPLMIL